MIHCIYTAKILQFILFKIVFEVNMQQKKILAERIRKNRESLRKEHLSKDGKKTSIRKWSTLDLAENLGVHRSMIEAWENEINSRAPTPNQLRQLCNLFQCDIGHLFGDYDSKKREIADIQEVTGLSETAINKLTALHCQFAVHGF